MRARIRHSHGMQREWFEVVIEDGMVRYVHRDNFRTRQDAQPLCDAVQAAIADGFDPWSTKHPECWVIEDASGPQQS